MQQRIRATSVAASRRSAKGPRATRLKVNDLACRQCATEDHPEARAASAHSGAAENIRTLMVALEDRYAPTIHAMSR